MSCKTNKKQFANKKEADLKIEEILLDDNVRQKTPVRSYLCEFCKKWHLTSVINKQSTQKQKEIIKKIHVKQLATDYIKKKKWDKD